MLVTAMLVLSMSLSNAEHDNVPEYDNRPMEHSYKFPRPAEAFALFDPLGECSSQIKQDNKMSYADQLTKIAPVLAAVLGTSAKIHGTFVYGYVAFVNAMIASKDFRLDEIAFALALYACPLVLVYYMDGLVPLTNALGCFLMTRNILTKDWWPTFLVTASVALHHALFTK